MPRPKKVGRPRLPRGHAKGRIVPVRFQVHELKAMQAEAKANKLILSEWIRSTLRAAIAK